MKKQTSSALIPVERACFNVVALIWSRLAGRALKSEVQRLHAQPKARSYAETLGVLGGLFGLALLATSLGLWALCLLFLAVILLFR